MDINTAAWVMPKYPDLIFRRLPNGFTQPIWDQPICTGYELDVNQTIFNLKKKVMADIEDKFYGSQLKRDIQLFQETGIVIIRGRGNHSHIKTTHYPIHL